MSTDASMRRIAALVLAGVIATLAVGVQADPNWRQNGNSEAAQSARSGGQCVRPTGEMRRTHMSLLKHDRDLTVLQGVRTVNGSLSGCVACHANMNDHNGFIAVNAEDQFCSGCHEYAGVSLDCFQCHSTVPTK